MTTAQTAKMVPFSSIYIPEEENARTDLKNIDKLAANIKEHGLIEPLVVTNGDTGKDDQTYRLHVGFRRAAALKSLKWGSKEVPVTVREVWNPLVIGAENFLREGLNPIDASQWCWGLFNGDYNAPDGHERVKHTDAQIGAAIGLSESSARNYRRVHERLSGDVRKLVRKHSDVPLKVLIDCVGKDMGEEVTEVDEETGAKTKSWVPNDAKQLSCFNKWLSKKEALEAEGRTRAQRGSGGGEGEGGEGGDGTTYKRKPSRVIEACVKILNRKKSEDQSYGFYAQALRFASGETDRLPGITKEELDEQLAKMKEAAKAGKEAE